MLDTIDGRMICCPRFASSFEQKTILFLPLFSAGTIQGTNGTRDEGAADDARDHETAGWSLLFIRLSTSRNEAGNFPLGRMNMNPLLLLFLAGPVWGAEGT